MGNALVSLTIYLAKPGYEDIKSCIKDAGTLNKFVVRNKTGELGTLFVQKRPAIPPSWGKFFEPGIKRAALGLNSSTAGVLHVPLKGKAFLLTFGQGRFLMEPNCYEDRFGLRVTLNSIAGDKVRQIDKHTLDAGRYSRVQMNRASSPGEFGLDVERDLVRGITGTPIEVGLGKTLSGVDALHAMVSVNLDTLKKLLAAYLEQSNKTDYQKHFAWVDHISDVKDKQKVEKLDKELLKLIAAKDWDKCWLAVPEVIDWAEITGFRHRRGAAYPVTHDLDFEQLLKDYDLDVKDITVDFLKGKEVYAEGGNDNETHSWSVYQCLYAELDHNGSTYILSDRRWYCISDDFVKEVDDYFAAIPKSKIKLPEYDHKSEGEYNARVVAESKGVHALMDRKMIFIGGGRSQIEFCDLFSAENEIVHVKRYGGSNMLSHLFAQGVVSGQLFLADGKFRAAVNKKLPKSHQFPNVDLRPTPDKYNIVFAIINRDKSDKVVLPFFSRLNARQAVQSLADGYGYRVSLLGIPATENAVKKKKYKKRKARGVK